MKTFVSKLRAGLVFTALALTAMLPSDGALAQVVTKLPVFVAPGTAVDLGNGPLEFLPVLGNGWIFTNQGSGVGSTSGASTTLTLTATPAVAPCVGCIISGAGITSGTTVAAFDGTTTITLSAAMTVAASTPLAWGAACPTTVAAAIAFPNMPIQASNYGYPFYTQARICSYSANGPGLQVLPFAIGAH